MTSRRFGELLAKFQKWLHKRKFDVAVAMEEANRLMLSGDRHSAIAVFRQIVEADPGNVAALSDLSALLSDTGQNEEARHLFELACALDDTFIPVILNHAKLLTDERRSSEALPMLVRAKAFDPFYPYVDSVYQSRLFQFGHTDAAREYQLKSWLAAFDRLRMANGQLFSSSYADIDEAQIAAEHRFWAETLPEPHALQQDLEAKPKLPDRRIRLGYLSPDFRNHAVRYFFRPLLENHDKSRFEVFLMHDFGPRDWQTDLIEAAAEHFENVSSMNDAALAEHIQKLGLDILVDLCGHTSYNRIDLYKSRLATLQINALGYPPTTGLGTMDYKLLDVNVVVPEYKRYYSERPLVLPTSFWCFDPLEDEAPITHAPPSATGAPVVFGCFGNICKITERMLAAWHRILEGVPDSTLRIRSVNFQDSAVIDDFRRRLVAFGYDIARVELEKPVAGTAFFASYNDVDIILDTFPFCGGTTTSFSVYMGVPVVTLAGASLVSRMGLSIMKNAGGQAWIAEDFEGYVACAIRLARDAEALLDFKRNARARMKACALGNGAMFAREFEFACQSALSERLDNPYVPHMHEVPLLEAQEIHRRAYQVLVNGQPEAAQRVLRHGLTHYPNHPGLQSLKTQLIADSEGPLAAVRYLEQRLSTFSSAEVRGPLMLLVGLGIQLGDDNRARAWLERLGDCDLSDPFDAAQFALYVAQLKAPFLEAAQSGPSKPIVFNPDHYSSNWNCKRICVLLCGTSKQCEAIQTNLTALSGRDVTGPSAMFDIEWRHCAVDNRMQAFESAAHSEFDAIVVMHAHVECVNPNWAQDIAHGLSNADVVGFKGSRSALRLDWRTESFALKAGSWMQPSERNATLDLHWFGAPGQRWALGMNILDGSFFACRGNKALMVRMDEELIGEQTYLEEDWILRVAQAGGRVIVDNAFGVVVRDAPELDRSNRAEARLHYVNKHQIDVFGHLTNDHLVALLPVADEARGLKIARALCQAT